MNTAMNDYPAAITAVNHVEPVPRRIRAFLGDEKVLDTTRALYVWEWPNYPQYYIPLADVRPDLLDSEGHTQQTGRGLVELAGLRVGDLHRPRAARILAESPIGGLSGTVRFDWAAMDAWYEEDEQVFVACPYKGTTSGYWSVRAAGNEQGTVHADLAWSYDFPTRQLLPIAGMIAFYNEKVDTILDGQRLDRPQTHFFPKAHDSSA